MQNKKSTTHAQVYEQNNYHRIDLEELINTSVDFDCVGKISKIDKDSKTVYVDFKGNPTGSPVLAKLGRPFTMPDLEKAINHVLDIKLEFENSDIEKPVITDVFYSILEDKTEKDQELQNIHIKGKRIILDADTEVVIKSGEASTTYCAKDGKLVSKAVDITSQALHRNEIKGGTIGLN